MGQSDIALVPVFSGFLHLVPLKTIQGATRHVTRFTSHDVIHFRAVLTFTGQARDLATVYRIGIVRYEAPLAKLYGGKETGDAGYDVKMTNPFVIHQIQTHEGPFLVLVVRNTNKFVTQRRRYYSNANLEGLFEGGNVIETSGSVRGHAGF